MRRLTVVLLLAAVAACSESGTRADRVEVGMCFDDQDGSEIERFPTVPCDEPHQNEVFHLFDVEGQDYPGVDALRAEGERVCRGEAFTRYVGETYEASRFDVFQILPTEGSWSEGDREVVCALYDPFDNAETGSARVTSA